MEFGSEEYFGMLTEELDYFKQDGIQKTRSEAGRLFVAEAIRDRESDIAHEVFRKKRIIGPWQPIADGTKVRADPSGNCPVIELSPNGEVRISDSLHPRRSWKSTYADRDEADAALRAAGYTLLQAADLGWNGSERR
jgi:hypothetical protein